MIKADMFLVIFYIIIFANYHFLFLNLIVTMAYSIFKKIIV